MTVCHKKDEGMMRGLELLSLFSDLQERETGWKSAMVCGNKISMRSPSKWDQKASELMNSSR